MARASVSIQSGAFLSGAQTISAQYFGGNLLFDRDKLGENGTYDEKAEALNLGLIRYPGGNVTELFFDISDPDRTVEPDGHSGSLLPLSDYLGYLSDSGAKGALVVPTVPFMNGLATGGMKRKQVKAEIKSFLQDLKAGVYGDASNIEHIELGNEYYGYEKFYSWSAVEQYAKIAPIWAKEIRKVFGDDLNISVQGGVNAEDNAVFLKAFKNKGDLVDSVIYHSYPWDLGQVYSHDEWKSWLSAQWTDAGLAEHVFISEWGLSNQRVGDNGELIGTDQIEDGLARAIAMVEMTALQIQSGVDFATVWPVQQNTRGDLAGNEGQTAENSAATLSEDGLTLAGEAFQLMSEALPGTRMLDLGGAVDLDGKRESDRFTPELLVRAFDDQTKVTIFASAWALDDALGQATLNLDLGGQFTSYDVTTLTVAGDNYTDPNADPVTITETGLEVSDTLTIDFTRTYELQRITLYKDPALGLGAFGLDAAFDGLEPSLIGGAKGEKLIGEEDNADGVWGKGGDDKLYGLGSGDQLNGGAGADSLYGGEGFDFLQGGGGVDRLFGGSGTDLLTGAGHGDVILGQGGSDYISGGAGDDTLLGGRQNDSVKGGGGHDLLKGDGGDDDLSAAGGNDTVSGGGGDDVLRGGAGDDGLTGGKGDDALYGGAGDDVVEVGPGADLAFGGAGADTFVIRKHSAGSVIGDFENGVDQFAFGSADRFSDLSFQQDDGGVFISAGSAAVFVEGVDMSDLGANDFIF